VAASVPRSRDDLPGIPFGKYRILRKLGEGGVGCVYEAMLPGPLGFTKRVAIKRLRPAVVKHNPWLHEAMVNEALIGGLLHHDNIVDVLEFDRVGRHFYLAMEYVEGLTLGEIVRICRERAAVLPRFAVVKLAIDACRGLHHAHRRRGVDGRRMELVHRDLKPSNIMLSTGGATKILDFGIAKAASIPLDTTTIATVKGTPRYMSPEQITGRRDLGPQSDLFSLAVVLYEMVTLEPAYQEASLISLALRIVKENPAVLARRAERMVPGLGPILQRALAKDPTYRYASARAMAADLRRLSRRYPAEADMAEVIARLMPAAPRPHRQTVRSVEDIDRDAAIVPLRHPSLDTCATPIEFPDPRSCDWQSFMDSFGLEQTSDDLDSDVDWVDDDLDWWDDPSDHAGPATRSPRPKALQGIKQLVADLAGQLRDRLASGRVPAGLPSDTVSQATPSECSFDDPTTVWDEPSVITDLPGWAIARLSDDPTTRTVAPLPRWAIDRLGRVDDTGTLMPLPGWAVERLMRGDDEPPARDLPTCALVLLHPDDPDAIPPLPDTAILHLAPAEVFRRAALLAAGGTAVALAGLASLVLRWV
jgi:serine/threonine protein kinase